MLLFGLFERGLIAILSFTVVIILAFAYHEFGHAIVADRLGDPTPRRHGRITLNPFPHLSLTGLVMLFLLGFGWATTPVNPGMFRGNIRQSHALVAIAGPIMNLMMASLFAVPFYLVNTGVIAAIPYEQYLGELFQVGVWLNIFLMLFNLLPIPPLDGFTVMQGILPLELARAMEPLRQWGMLIFFLIFFALPNELNPFTQVIQPLMLTISNFLMGCDAGLFSTCLVAN